MTQMVEFIFRLDMTSTCTASIETPEGSEQFCAGTSMYQQHVIIIIPTPPCNLIFQMESSLNTLSVILATNSLNP